ncbi:MAG TPA: hypothetical protein DEA96_10525 [Leptospiraceae bacterium]|nr:hypothetical protein [Spirochaetaceae bacterium]HBS05392.1 hypothetical protein [Leptospiraceae bacterium]
MGTHLENLRVKGQDEEVKNTPYSFRGGGWFGRFHRKRSPSKNKKWIGPDFTKADILWSKPE